MLKYLVILLDDSSISYCCYSSRKESRLMPIETVQKAILFAMKNDLRIQYVLPPYELPRSYNNLMNSMFHDNIGGIGQENLADIMIINGITAMKGIRLQSDKRYLVRTSIQSFFANTEILKEAFSHNVSVNIVFTDVDAFSEEDVQEYGRTLDDLARYLYELILKGYQVNSNLLTDRIALDEMNNCGAGDTSITLAPNGKFYPCPGFYYDNDKYCEAGDIDSGVFIKNMKLFTIKGAPLCKRCDAYHCKRCVWLNKKLTCEVNIPSRQQCVMAHVERNASMRLLEEFQKQGLLTDKNIDSIDYLDPFDKYQGL